MNKNDMEIERKFLIRRPGQAYLESAGEWTSIEQTYLNAPEGITARVRKRGREGAWTYTQTIKSRITERSRVEIEHEIPEQEFKALLEQADPERRRIDKTRWCIPCGDVILEIDIYPFWEDRAILEIELEDEQQSFVLPAEIQVIREVTSDGRYTNSSLAREIPMDPIA